MLHPSCYSPMAVVWQVMHDSDSGEPRYRSDAYELQGFELPVGLLLSMMFLQRFSAVH